MANLEKTQVVVFDLNKTFYYKSSKDEFYKFICSKRPWRIRYFFEMIYYKFLLKINQIRQTEFKENFFNYLDGLPPEKVKAYAEEFWKLEYPKNFNPEIKARLEKARAAGKEIFCASGAFEVYLEPLFKLYPVDGFAGTKARFTGQTYVIEGRACKDEEKTRRLEEHYQGKPFTITEAYSDKKEDMFDQTEKPFLVKKGKLVPYKKK